MKNTRHETLLYLAFLSALSASAHGQVPLFERYGNAAGDQFGTAVASVGDVDADGANDWAVGAPFDDVAANNAGMVVVYSGATSQILYTWRGTVADERLGTAVAGAGDLDGDGSAEVIVGSPGAGIARVFSGGTGLVLHTLGPGGSTWFGQSVAGGGELDGDGVPDLLVGEPREDAGGSWRGRVRLFSGATGSQIRRIDGTGNWGNFGWSVAFMGDLDGDLLDEFAVGAPSLSIVGLLPYVRAFDAATGDVLWTDKASDYSDAHGFSLASIGDLSGDGLRDLLVGAMQDTGVGCACQGKGYVRALNGVSGAQLYQVDNTTGFLYTGYGWSIAVVGDLDGNGFEDFAASRPGTEGCNSAHQALEVRDGKDGALLLSIAPPTGSGNFGASLAFGDANGDGLEDLLCGAPCSDPGDAGAVYAFTLVRDVTPYCSAKVNSQGCTPFIQGVGTPSATVPVPFRVKAFQVLNNKNGLLFYGFGPKATPFQAGTLCVSAPIRRTAIQGSNGNPPPNDCSGFYSLDFNQRIRSGVDPALVVGEEVFCQYWSRDPTSPKTTGLTDALAFYIHP